MDSFHLLKRYFSFSKKEAADTAITALALGFVFAFNEWGVSEFNISSGMYAWLNSALVSVLCIFMHILPQKALGIVLGYKVEYRKFIWGLAFSLIVVFYSFGAIFAAVPGIISITLIQNLRIGKRWQGVLKRDEAMISFIGPYSNALIALLLTGLVSAGVTNPLVAKVALICKLMAVFSILPIPLLDGFKIFYFSRSLGLFALLLIVIMVVMMTWSGFLSTLITSLFLAAVFAAVYFIRYEL
jgi:hypothetical protein